MRCFYEQQNFSNRWNMRLCIFLWPIWFHWRKTHHCIETTIDVIMSNRFAFIWEFFFEMICWLTLLHCNLIIVAWKLVLDESFDCKTIKIRLTCSIWYDLLIFLTTCFLVSLIVRFNFSLGKRAIWLIVFISIFNNSIVIFHAFFELRFGIFKMFVNFTYWLFINCSSAIGRKMLMKSFK